MLARSMSMLPSRLLIATALVATTVGCVGPREPGAPIRLGLHPYAGPAPDARGDFVLSYDPWTRRSAAHAAATGATTDAKVLGDVIVRCRNVKCVFDSKTHRLTVESPPPGLARLDVTMQKEGFDPVELSVPIITEDQDQDLLVVLTPARSR